MTRLRSFEHLAATEGIGCTERPGKQSFTRALIYALESLVNERPDGRFTTVELLDKIKYDAPDFPRHQDPMLINRHPNQYEGCIILHPLLQHTSVPSQRESSDDESEVHSIVSVEAPSIFSDITLSSTSSVAEIQGAAEEFAKVLFADETLKPLYVTALQRIDLQRLERNLARLLKSYAKDLRAEATTVLERTAVKFARSHAQSIAFHLCTSIDPSWNARYMEMHLLSTQAPRQEGRIEQYLRQLANSGNPGVASNTTEAPPDNEVDPNDESSDDSGLDEANRPDLSNLNEVKAFMTKSNAFAGLKESFRNFVAPAAEDKGREQVNRELEEERPAIVSSSDDSISPISSSDPSTPRTSASPDTSRRENQNVSEVIRLPFVAKEPSLHSARPTATSSNYALVIISNISQVFLNSLMLHAYNYIQDRAFGIIQYFSPFEAPLLEHSVRLRWTCVRFERPSRNSRESDTTTGMR